ncbi:MAG: hypothetical protein GY729_11800, partial [Desulfobacteraceae bacterium]|nr:hypothetical protein [Desulfobacteraceae bacterium]
KTNEQIPLSLPKSDLWLNVTSLSLDNAGKFGIIGDMAGNLWLWNIIQNRCADYISVGEYPIKNAKLSPDGILLVDDGDRIILLRQNKENRLKQEAVITLPDVEQAIFGRNHNEIIARTFGGAMVCFEYQ